MSLRAFFCLCALVMVLAAGPSVALADTEFPEQSATCQDNYAQWVWAKGEPDTDAGFASPPKGTSTHILACRVSGHHVRINSQIITIGTYRCGATTYGEVSVWVDGVKAVDRREFGDYMACQLAEERRTPVRIIVNRLLRMTICTADPYDDEVATTACELIPLDLAGKPRDQLYDGSLVRTKPGLRLISGDSSQCEPLLPELGLNPENGRPTTALPGIPGNFGVYGEAWGLDETDNATYSADLDNDGLTDRLDIAFERNERNLPGALTWTPASNGAAVGITETLLQSPDAYGTEDVTDSLEFVQVDGTVYLYRYTNYFASGFIVNDLDGAEAAHGAYDGETLPTRQLYRLSPDGTASLVCGWSPIKRPEEFV